MIREATILEIKACTGENCDEKEISQLLRKIDVEIMFMNANFDPKSIASPINFFYDLRLNEQVVADISKNFMINVMSQRAELVDDYLGQMKQTYRFFQVNNVESKLNRYDESTGVLVHYEFQASNMNTRYSRSIFNLFDLASRLGGVFAAMRIGGVVFTSAFSYRLLMSSLIGKLFHFRPKFQMEMKKSKKAKKKGKSKKKL